MPKVAAIPTGVLCAWRGSPSSSSPGSEPGPVPSSGYSADVSIEEVSSWLLAPCSVLTRREVGPLGVTANVSTAIAAMHATAPAAAITRLRGVSAIRISVARTKPMMAREKVRTTATASATWAPRRSHRGSAPPPCAITAEAKMQ